MHEIELIDLKKTRDFPSVNDVNWGKLLLSRLLTEISEDYVGSVYAEEVDGKVEIRVSTNKEKMLNKTGNFKVMASYYPSILNKFVTYINKELFQLEPSSLCAGIMKVKFSCETDIRMFTVFSRRSGLFGDFFQIDQFKNHL